MMASALYFVPSYIKLHTNLVTVWESKRGSAGVSLRTALERRLIVYSPYLGRLAPYLERLLWRPSTPEASKVPRMMW